MTINTLMGDSGKSHRGPDFARRLLEYLEGDNPRLSKMQVKALIKERGLRDRKALLSEDDIESDGAGVVRRKRATPPLKLNSYMRELVRSAINTSPHLHKYITGALCWSIEENPILAENPHLAIELKDRFEAYVFTGINLEDQLIYWVQHTDKDRLEYNYVIPQICPSTGYHWNPLPPGKEYEFNLIRDHFNLEFDLVSPDDQRYLKEGPKRAFVPQKSKFFLPVPPFEGKSGARSKAIDYLYAKIQSFDITCFEDVYQTLASNAFTKSTGLRFIPGQRCSLGSSRHGAYVTLLNADNKPIRLKGFAFSRRFTPNTRFTSRVQDARYDKETTKRVLREMQWEIRNMLMQRAFTQRQRCYPSEIHHKPTFRYRKPAPEAEVSPASISSMLNQLLSVTLDTSTALPKFSDNMSHAEFEQVLLTLLTVLAALQRRAIDKDVKAYLERLEAINFHLNKEQQHVHYSGGSRTTPSLSRTHQGTRSAARATGVKPPASELSNAMPSRHHRAADEGAEDGIVDTIRRCRDRLNQFGQQLQKDTDIVQ